MEGFISLFLFILIPIVGVALIVTSLSKKYSSRKSRFLFGVLSLCLPILYLSFNFKYHYEIKGLIYGEYSLKGEKQIKLVLKTDSTFQMDYLSELSQYDKGKWETLEWDYHELKLKSNEGMNRQISFEIINKGERVELKYNPWKKDDPKPERELVFIKEQK